MNFDEAVNKLSRMSRAGVLNSADGKPIKVNFDEAGNVTGTNVDATLNSIADIDTLFESHAGDIESFESSIAKDVYDAEKLVKESPFPASHYPGVLENASEMDMQGLWMIFNAPVEHLVEKQDDYNFPDERRLPGGQLVTGDGDGEIAGTKHKHSLLLRYTTLSEVIDAAEDGSGDKLLYTDDKYLSEYLVRMRGSFFLTAYQPQDEEPQA